MERLRDEALEIFARIKISKMKMIRVLSKSCSDKHLAEQNSKLLHARDDIPINTKFYCDLQTFQAVKRAQKECSDLLHVPLYPPGKIVYLVKTRKICRAGMTTSKRNKYTAQWAEKTDFNEILMSRTAVHDHSADMVEENLADILISFLKEADDLSFVEEDNKNAASIFDVSTDEHLVLERDFICCSRPHGNAPFIPSILASAAWILSVLCNNWCAFVSRTTVVIKQDNFWGEWRPHDGLDVSTGLWSYLEKEYDGTGPKDDPDSYVDSGICSSFPQDFTPDSYLMAARTSATICNLVGLFSMICLWFASCVSYRRRIWILLTSALLLASLFQGLVALFFRSDLCNRFVFEVNGLPKLADSTCSLAWGAKVGIASFVLWFCAAVSTAMCGLSNGHLGEGPHVLDTFFWKQSRTI